jgi:hypothetical protein
MNDETDGTAVIVEPRNHKALSFVLTNMHNNLPKNWNIIWCHTDITDTKTILEKVKIPRLSTLLLKHKGNMNIGDYNNLLCSEEFWNYFNKENILIFQTDSIIISESPFDLREYLDFDYIGSPWPFIDMFQYCGNGGLSFRKKSAMLKVIKTLGPNPGMPEDVFMSTNARHVIKVAPRYIAQRFGKELVKDDRLFFGCHKMYAYQPVDAFPEIQTLQELNR